VNGASFSPDGARVVTAGFDHTARLWKAETGEPIATLTGHNDRVIAAAFNQDGSRVVTASADRTARLWDGNSGAPIATLAGHGDWVNGAAFSANGRRIVTASFDAPRACGTLSAARSWRSSPGIPIE
jgi:WD40 repeat protein